VKSPYLNCVPNRRLSDCVFPKFTLTARMEPDEGGVMRHRSIATVFVLALLGALPLGAAPAGASDATDTHCLAEFDVILDPGISMSPASGTFTTNGEVGWIRCDGPVDGYQPTGIGTRGEAGRYGVTGPNSCSNLNGESEWTISFTMPTTAGKLHLDHLVRGPYGPLQGDGLIGGTFTGDGMYGKYHVTPVEGDCATSPWTKLHLVCDEWLVNGKPDVVPAS
jgi:hypothetical protein